LRWGHTTKGTFTISKAYDIQARQEEEGHDIIWKKVWNGGWWPKVTHFFWMVRKGRTLIWDQVQKIGFQGPSFCGLCHQNGKDMEHLLNNCPFAKQKWRQMQGVFERMDRDQNSIKGTIILWRTHIYSSLVVNRTWNLGLGFILWAIWKERNHRIFKHKTTSQEKVWEGIFQNIRETILKEAWHE